MSVRFPFEVNHADRRTLLASRRVTRKVEGASGFADWMEGGRGGAGAFMRYAEMGWIEFTDGAIRATASGNRAIASNNQEEEQEEERERWGLSPLEQLRRACRVLGLPVPREKPYGPPRKRGVALWVTPTWFEVCAGQGQRSIDSAAANILNDILLSNDRDWLPV